MNHCLLICSAALASLLALPMSASAQVAAKRLLIKATPGSNYSSWKVTFTNNTKQTIEFEAFVTNFYSSAGTKSTVGRKSLGKYKLRPGASDDDGGGTFTPGNARPEIEYESLQAAAIDPPRPPKPVWVPTDKEIEAAKKKLRGLRFSLSYAQEDLREAKRLKVTSEIDRLNDKIEDLSAEIVQMEKEFPGL